MVFFFVCYFWESLFTKKSRETEEIENLNRGFLSMVCFPLSFASPAFFIGAGSWLSNYLMGLFNLLGN